ncbi:MAG: DUF4136 domain-containing protein [Alphaproteobacteria bacterium]
MRQIVIALLALVVGACESVNAPRVNYDRATDFSRYRSYSWGNTYAEPAPGSEGGISSATMQQVRAAIDRTLAAKGFALAGGGDFVVEFTVTRREQTELRAGRFTEGFRDDSQLIYRDDPIGGRRFVLATLIIEIFDAETSRSVWRGSQSIEAQGIVREVVNITVRNVLARFPPPAS